MFETNLSEQFLVAVKLGKPDEIQRIAKYGADVNITDAAGSTALHQAAFQGRCDLVGVLIDIGCDVNAEDQDGCTPLHRAVVDGHFEVVNQLINAGCSLDKQDKNGNTALLEAAWNGYSQTVQLLVDAKCDINITNKTCYSALHLAAQNNHNKTLEILLKEGCDPSARNNFGDTPLHVAAKYGHIEACSVIIQNGGSTAEQNQEGDTVLHSATELNNAELVEYLLDVGCFTTIQNKKGETPRDIAVRQGYNEIAYMIQESNSPRPSSPGIKDDSVPRVAISPVDVNVSGVSACTNHSWSTPNEEPQSPKLKPGATHQGEATGEAAKEHGKDTKLAPKTHKLRYDELCSIEKAFLVDRDVSKNRNHVRKSPPHFTDLNHIQNDYKINHSIRREKTMVHAPVMPEFYDEPWLQRSSSDTSLHIKPSLWDLCGILTCFSRHTSPAYRKTKVQKYKPSGYFDEEFVTPVGRTIEMSSFPRRSHNNTDGKHHHSKHRHSRSPSNNRTNSRSRSEPKHAWNEENYVEEKSQKDKKHNKHKRTKSEPAHVLDSNQSRDASKERGKNKRQHSSHKRDKSHEREDSRGRGRSFERESGRHKERDSRSRDKHKSIDSTRGRGGSKSRDSSMKRDKSKDNDTKRRDESKNKSRSENRGSESVRRSKSREGHRSSSGVKTKDSSKAGEREKRADRHKRERVRESSLKAKQRKEHKISTSADVYELKHSLKTTEKHTRTPVRVKETSPKTKKKEQSVDGDADVESTDSSDNTDGSIRQYLKQPPNEESTHKNKVLDNETVQKPRHNALPKTTKALYVVESLTRLEAKQDKCAEEINHVKKSLGGRIDKLEEKFDDHLTSSLFNEDQDSSPELVRKYHNIDNSCHSIEENLLSNRQNNQTTVVYRSESEQPENQQCSNNDVKPNAVKEECSKFVNMNGLTASRDIESLERRTYGRTVTKDMNGVISNSHKLIPPEKCTRIVRAHYLDMSTNKNSIQGSKGSYENTSYRDGLGSTGSSPYESSRPSAGDISHSPLSDDCVFHLWQPVSPKREDFNSGKNNMPKYPGVLHWDPESEQPGCVPTKISESSALDSLLEASYVPPHIKYWLEHQLEQAHRHLRRENAAEKEVIMAHIREIEKHLNYNKPQCVNACYV